MLSTAVAASLLAHAVWADVSILLALEALGHAALWVIGLHVFQVVPHNYALLDQAVRLRGVVDSHD
jgi:hypothetical protein